jgi:two-component system sensor histidine kinase YesM
MRHILDIRIKSQVVLFGVTCFLLMMSIQVAYQMVIDRIAFERSRASVQAMSDRIESDIIRRIVEVQNVATILTLNRYTQFYLLEEDALRRIEYNAYLNEMMRYLDQANVDIDDILLVDQQERRLSVAARLEIPVEQQLIRDSMEKADAGKFWISNQVLTQDGIRRYVLVTSVLDRNVDFGSASRSIGSCFIVCNVDAFSALVRASLPTQNSLVALLDRKGALLAASDRKIGLTTESPLLAELAVQHPAPEGHSVRTIGSVQYLVYSRRIDPMGWELVSAIPSSDLSRDFDSFRLFVYSLGGVSTLLILSWVYLILRRIYRPIARIKDFLARVPDTGMRARIRYGKTHNEIGSIADAIDGMLDENETMTHRVFDQQNRMYQLEILNREATLANFFSQMNPHFLYNTLETVRSLGVINQDDRIVRVSTALASILRYSIRSEMLVPLRDEIHCVRDYVGILEIRLDGDISCDIDVPESLMETRVIKMLLQPLVENSIKHGNPFVRHLHVGITATEADGFLVLQVSDNGAGMTAACLATLRERIADPKLLDYEHGQQTIAESIGLTNIVRRLQLTFGVEASLSVESEEEKGTCITIRHPFIAQPKIV